MAKKKPKNSNNVVKGPIAASLAAIMAITGTVGVGIALNKYVWKDSLVSTIDAQDTNDMVFLTNEKGQPLEVIGFSAGIVDNYMLVSPQEKYGYLDGNTFHDVLTDSDLDLTVYANKYHIYKTDVESFLSREDYVIAKQRGYVTKEDLKTLDKRLEFGYNNTTESLCILDSGLYSYSYLDNSMDEITFSDDENSIAVSYKK